MFLKCQSLIFVLENSVKSFIVVFKYIYNQVCTCVSDIKGFFFAVNVCVCIQTCYMWYILTIDTVKVTRD